MPLLALTAATIALKTAASAAVGLLFRVVLLLLFCYRNDLRLCFRAPQGAHGVDDLCSVLLQPVDENLPGEFTGVSRQQLETEGTAYVAASYIKYIESAGCVVSP